MIKRLLGVTLFGSLGLISIVMPLQASAISASNWQSGRIIDDNVFTNKGAMNANDIQNFLNQKVGTTQANGTPGVCDTNGTKPSEFGGGTRAQWGAAHSSPAPYTCLKDYYEVPKTTPGPGIPANNYGGAPIPSGAISAAQIIYNAAQQYNINPKVLLTVLQKESTGPLVTDDWPTASQYVHPMGAHCPDSNSCDPNYYGFSMQMFESARLFRSYLDNMDQAWWGCTDGSGAKIQCASNAQNGSNPGAGYKVPFTSDFILWSPTTSCGGANIYMTGKATAALYTYTPYQPNTAALNNLYGSGDSCSSYGNRNFWRMFNDWFGSPYGNYAWSSGGYKVYDQTGTTQLDPGKLQPGQHYIATLTATNIGTATWTNSGPNPVYLAGANPASRTSSFCQSSWIACNRPAALTEASVDPGQTGHFTFAFAAPYTPGAYREYFKPVSEFFAWFGDIMPDESLGIQVLSPGTYQWSSGGYKVMDLAKTTTMDPGQLQPGQRYVAILSATNTGTATWTNSGPAPVTLATSGSQSSSLCNNTWLACNRPAYLTESSVAPGQVGHFEFTFQAPYTPGPSREYFKPVAEFLSWFNDSPPNDSLGIWTVSPGSFSWSAGRYILKDQSNQQVDPGRLTHGQTYTATLTATNTGTATWTNAGTMPVTLATSAPQSHNSSLCNNTWLACNRPAYLTESSVAPGQVGHFTFTFQAPATLGAYRESFKPVAEFYSWFNDSPPNDSLGIWVTQ